MKSFLNWLEDAVAAAPAATTSVSGSPGATTSNGIAPYLQPVGIGTVVKRQFPGEHRRHRRHKKHKR
jgi:hypothetical protein